MSGFEFKAYRDHGSSPAVTMYIMNDTTRTMEKISCMYCKRTIADIKGVVERVITTPVAIEDFGIGINIRCKLCQQNYRFVTNPKIMIVEVQIQQR